MELSEVQTTTIISDQIPRRSPKSKACLRRLNTSVEVDRHDQSLHFGNDGLF